MCLSAVHRPLSVVLWVHIKASYSRDLTESLEINLRYSIPWHLSATSNNALDLAALMLPMVGHNYFLSSNIMMQSAACG